MNNAVFFPFCLVPVFKGSSTAQSNQNLTNVPMINVTLTNDFCLVIGTITFLRQFKSDYRNEFIAMLAQYVRSAIVTSATQKSSELPVEPSKIINFLETFIECSHLDRKVI